MFVSDQSDVNARYIYQLISQIKREEWSKIDQKRKNLEVASLAEVVANYYTTELASSNPSLDKAVTETVSYLSSNWFIWPLSDQITARIGSMAEQDETVKKIFLEKPFLKEEVNNYWAKHPLSAKQECDYYEVLREKLNPLVKHILDNQFDFKAKEGIVKRIVTYLSRFAFRR